MFAAAISDEPRPNFIITLRRRENRDSAPFKFSRNNTESPSSGLFSGLSERNCLCQLFNALLAVVLVYQIVLGPLSLFQYCMGVIIISRSQAEGIPMAQARVLSPRHIQADCPAPAKTETQLHF